MGETLGWPSELSEVRESSRVRRAEEQKENNGFFTIWRSFQERQNLRSKISVRVTLNSGIWSAAKG